MTREGTEFVIYIINEFANANRGISLHFLAIQSAHREDYVLFYVKFSFEV